MLHQLHQRAAFWLMVTSAIGAAQLTTAVPGWRVKPPAQWTEEDARQVLTSSPWVRTVGAGIAGRETEDQLREGGVMGQPHGVGYDGIDPKGSGPKVTPNIFTGAGGDDRSERSRARGVLVRVCWQSGLPVRLAELKSHEIEPPVLEGEGYEITVYGVPGGEFKGDPKQLGDPLKKMAALKRQGKADVRPLRVEVFPGQDGLTVVYLFPPSAEIVKRDGWVRFEAHIGRVSVAHTFDLTQMEFQGRLEL